MSNSYRSATPWVQVVLLLILSHGFIAFIAFRYHDVVNDVIPVVVPESPSPVQSPKQATVTPSKSVLDFGTPSKMLLSTAVGVVFGAAVQAWRTPGPVRIRYPMWSHALNKYIMHRDQLYAVEKLTQEECDSSLEELLPSFNFQKLIAPHLMEFMSILATRFRDHAIDDWLVMQILDILHVSKFVTLDVVKPIQGKVSYATTATSLSQLLSFSFGKKGRLMSIKVQDNYVKLGDGVVRMDVQDLEMKALLEMATLPDVSPTRPHARMDVALSTTLRVFNAYDRSDDDVHQHLRMIPAPPDEAFDAVPEVSAWPSFLRSIVRLVLDVITDVEECEYIPEFKLRLLSFALRQSEGPSPEQAQGDNHDKSDFELVMDTLKNVVRQHLAQSQFVSNPVVSLAAYTPPSESFPTSVAGDDVAPCFHLHYIGDGEGITLHIEMEQHVHLHRPSIRLDTRLCFSAEAPFILYNAKVRPDVRVRVGRGVDYHDLKLEEPTMFRPLPHQDSAFPLLFQRFVQFFLRQFDIDKAVSWVCENYLKLGYAEIINLGLDSESLATLPRVTHLRHVEVDDASSPLASAYLIGVEWTPSNDFMLKYKITRMPFSLKLSKVKLELKLVFDESGTPVEVNVEDGVEIVTHQKGTSRTIQTVLSALGPYVQLRHSTIQN